MPEPGQDETHDDFIDRCIPIVIDDGTAESPEQAVAVCNSIWDKDKDKQGASMPKKDNGKSSQFLFVELIIGETSKPFDGVAPGEFVDMWGREVDIEAKDFPKYLENTIDAIAHSVTEGGEVVGLPIDAVGHLDDEAAGWIVDAQLSEVEKPGGKKMQVIQFFANWTDKGRELIESGKRRMFSPTLNTKKKIVLGGSLTNWPATRDDMGKVLLRPISLSENGTPIDLEREANHIEGTELYAANLVAVKEKEEGAYEETENVADTTENVQKESNLTNKEKGETNMTEEVKTYTQEELDALVAEQAEVKAAELIASMGVPTGKGDKPEGEFDLLKMFNLEHLEDETVARMQEVFAAEYVRLQKVAEEAYIRKLALITRQRDLTELSTELTSGTEEAPRGLPIQADQLSEAMLRLPEDQVPFWKDLLVNLQKQGLTEFKELGHGKETEAKEELPEYYAEKLRSGELKVADLSDPIMGMDSSKYDLSEYKD